MIPLMNDGGGQRDYFVLDGNYQHFYYLTSDHKGELILRLLCDAEQRAVLDDILSQDLSPCYPDWSVENDAMDGDSPVLFAYTCDMPRIRRFHAALEKMDWTGTLFCFDFQINALKQICGQRALTMKRSRLCCLMGIFELANSHILELSFIQQS